MTSGAGFEGVGVAEPIGRRRPRAPVPGLPTVSVVVVNHNYGRYVGEALESVAAQTYPNVEAIVVDDASSDDSAATIAALTGPDGPHPEATFLEMPRNGGQTAASAYGFARTRGAYVVFLDADDVLLPRCLESHVYAHLSSRIAVGFSTVDVFNRVDGQDVTTGTEGFATFVASGVGQVPGAFRPIDRVHPDGWFAGRERPFEAGELHVARAPMADPWIWAPTSANCFRREAVAKMLHGDDLEAIRWGTDAYIMRAIAALHGSMLIDRPLMAYRIHGRNVFCTGAPLARTLGFDPRSQRDEIAATLKASVRRIIADLPSHAHAMTHPEAAWDAVQSLCKAWPGLGAENGGKDFLTEQLIANEAMLTRLYGHEKVASWLMWSGAAPARGARTRLREVARRLLGSRGPNASGSAASGLDASVEEVRALAKAAVVA